MESTSFTLYEMFHGVKNFFLNINHIFYRILRFINSLALLVWLKEND